MLVSFSDCVVNDCHVALLFECCWDFPGGSDSKESAFNVGDPGSIPGSERFPGEGNGYPRQYSCLQNFMYREAWWATVQRDECKILN